jgi:hypothetical protein
VVWHIGFPGKLLVVAAVLGVPLLCCGQPAIPLPCYWSLTPGTPPCSSMCAVLPCDGLIASQLLSSSIPTPAPCVVCLHLF